MYYFAYGSNLNWPQMQRRCPSSQFICIARLPDYQFGITRHSRLRNCGTANVIAAPGWEVWGAVYDICDEELLILDSFEDGYRRQILPVFGLNGRDRPLQALVYVAEDRGSRIVRLTIREFQPQENLRSTVWRFIANLR